MTAKVNGRRQKSLLERKGLNYGNSYKLAEVISNRDAPDQAQQTLEPDLGSNCVKKKNLISQPKHTVVGTQKNSLNEKSQ